jgi:hypothetical protein
MNKAQEPNLLDQSGRPAAIVRTCQQCGALDRELPGPPDDPAKHFVQIELYFFRRLEDSTDPISQLRMKRKGWRAITVNGRKGFERFTCVDCLNANQVADKMHAEYKRAALRLEKPRQAENFYLILCDVDGG